MQYFVYGRDKPGGFDIKVRLNEEHWTFMDGYGDALIARGPTLTEDREESTGSLHIVELPDVEAVNSFAYEEPYYLAGAFESVLISHFHNRNPGRTMWDFANAVEGYGRYLVFGEGPVSSPHVILSGDISTGQIALLEAPDPQAAATLFTVTTEVHPWEFGGRRD